MTLSALIRRAAALLVAVGLAAPALAQDQSDN